MKFDASRRGTAQNEPEPDVLQPLAQPPPQTPEGRNHPVILQVTQANKTSNTITIKLLDTAWSFIQNTGYLPV